VCKETNTKKTSVQPLPERKPQVMTCSLFPIAPIVPNIHEVNQAAAIRAWGTLTRMVEPNDQFWTDLLCAINEMKREIEMGASISNIIESIMMKYPAFTSPLIAEDVVTILNMEAYQKQEIIDSSVEFELWLW
jgi:hypothetical protein